MSQSEAIAIFDIDGVLIRNPEDALDGPPIIDMDYWHNHWNNPDYNHVQHDMVALVKALQQVGIKTVFLTARPAQFRGVTLDLLQNIGVTEGPAFVSWDLEMLPASTVPQSSASWKHQTVYNLKKNYNVLFMVEDYKWNAEAVRSLVPVLLYERKKPSRHIALSCSVCYGLLRCICPPSQ